MAQIDDVRCKELLRQFKQQEHTTARARLRLTPEQLDALHAYLETAGEDASGDRTPRFTEAWARQNGLPVDRLLEAFGEFGGYCDCEVLANVTRDRFGWSDRPDRN